MNCPFCKTEQSPENKYCEKCGRYIWLTSAFAYSKETGEYWTHDRVTGIKTHYDPRTGKQTETHGAVG